MMKQIQKPSYWENLAKRWEKVAPPVRPSREDLKIYEEFLQLKIKKEEKPKVLIWGATPELRDLAHKYKAEVTVCDISLDMILAMTKLMKYKEKLSKEILVKADWSTVPLQQEYYNVILGDAVNLNISWQKEKIWWQHSAELLQKGGVFITKMVYMVPKLHKKSEGYLEKLLKKLKKRKPTFKDLAYLKLTLEGLGYNPVTKTASALNYKNLIFKYAKKFSFPKNKTKSLYEKFISVYSLNKHQQWRGPTKKEAEKEAKRYFRILSQKISQTQPLNASVYLLKKK